ncbi:MAG TPA: GNAT family protein [Gemmatimonadales bacterium]|nr:GNAT family protein [Gemmatimonadales bacterium]
MDLTPRTLEGPNVRLEPLTEDHLDGLCDAGLDPELWRLTVNRIRTRADMARYLAEALAEQRAGTALPFATVWRDSGRVIGSTRFGNASPPNRRVEIGWTWLARAWQRTGANTEAKYLMLRHAFDQWGCIRVELKTSALNQRSRAAILRIGAREEGILRHHMINEDGSLRDSVFFSLLAEEWPEARRRLEGMLAAHGVRVAEVG